MPNLISSLIENEEIVDVFLAVNPTHFRPQNPPLEGIVNTYTRSWEITDTEQARIIRDWLGKNCGKTKEGKPMVYAWLPGAVTYDNIPRDKFEEFIKQFGEPKFFKR